MSIWSMRSKCELSGNPDGTPILRKVCKPLPRLEYLVQRFFQADRRVDIGHSFILAPPASVAQSEIVFSAADPLSLTGLALLFPSTASLLVEGLTWLVNYLRSLEAGSRALLFFRRLE